MKDIKQVFFLASSWFWCIGGFFPVLLMSEFGKIAFFPFFFSNVIGAAAFAFILSAERRERFLRHFDGYTQLFSVVVVGYHAIFITWLSLMLGSAIPGLLFLGLTVLFRFSKIPLPQLAVGLFFITAILFLLSIFQPEIGEQRIDTRLDGFGHYVLPITLGFLLAPYFDLTFHRAYCDSENPRLTFFLGFCGLFSLFLVGMFFITPILASLWLPQLNINSMSLVCIVTLLTFQTAFTTAAHWKELTISGWLNARTAKKVLAIVGLGVGLHLFVAMMKPEQLFNIGDAVYRTFLFIIGAVFPVVLLFGGLDVYAKLSIGLLTLCYTLGFFIGGSLTPFLSMGMLGLAILYFIHRKAQRASF